MPAKLKLSKGGGRRAAAYFRRSTEDQRASIEGQRQAVIEYAHRHGYEIVAEFVDSGISGVDSSGRRPQFTRMIQAAERGDFDFVIAWDMSRITRSDPMTTMAELKPLRDAGVKIATTDRSEPRDWDNFGDFLTTAVDSHSNNDYVRKLARGTLRGQRDCAKEGRWVAGRPPLGYRVDESHRLQLGDPAAVSAVQWAFDAYANGSSFRGVQEGLNQRGFTMVVSSVRFMLQNRLYTGDFTWGRTRQGKMLTYKDGEMTSDFERGDADEGDHVVVADNHAPIVDRGLFDRVQGMFANRRGRSTPHRNGGSFVLTGLLRCGDCGRRLVGQSEKRADGGTTIRYRCGGSQTKGVQFCHPHLVRQPELLAAVLESFRDRYANPKTIERLKAEIRRQAKASARTTDTKAIERQLSKERSQLTKATRKLIEVDADLLDIVQDEVRSIRTRIEGLERDLKSATVSADDIIKDVDVRAERAAETLKRFEELHRQSDPAALRSFLLETIDCIKVQVSRKQTGSRWRYSFEGGEIILKQDADLFDSW